MPMIPTLVTLPSLSQPAASLESGQLPHYSALLGHPQRMLVKGNHPRGLFCLHVLSMCMWAFSWDSRFLPRPKAVHMR